MDPAPRIVGKRRRKAYPADGNNAIETIHMYHDALVTIATLRIFYDDAMKRTGNATHCIMPCHVLGQFNTIHLYSRLIHAKRDAFYYLNNRRCTDLRLFFLLYRDESPHDRESGPH